MQIESIGLEDECDVVKGFFCTAQWGNDGRQSGYKDVKKNRCRNHQYKPVAEERGRFVVRVSEMELFFLRIRIYYEICIQLTGT